MNDKVKKIIYGITAFFAGIFAFILRAKICNHRDTANSTRDRVEELKRRADEQQSNNRAAIEGIEGALNTIAEIRKNQKYVEDDSTLDQWYCRELFDNNNN